MVLKLDPRYRLLWRTPTSLQFGVDNPRVTLSELSVADDRMIAGLIRGISRSGLSMIAEDAGADESEVSRLLDAVAPILHTEVVGTHAEPNASLRRVCLSGVGRTADNIAAILSTADITVHRGEPDAERVELAIIVAQFVIEPELHGAWLRRDVPHLAVVFGDAQVRIGPVVEPGATPCLYCLERHATDADPARTAIASQLWGQRSPVETGLVSSEVAALVARYAVSRLSGQRQEPAVIARATSL
ncbi:MAG: hypothetical protein ABI400_07415, partial [Lacisediminihabitans sp.]